MPICRPWWANRKNRGGHSHALTWQAAGWKTRNFVKRDNQSRPWLDLELYGLGSVPFTSRSRPIRRLATCCAHSNMTSLSAASSCALSRLRNAVICAAMRSSDGFSSPASNAAALSSLKSSAATRKVSSIVLVEPVRLPLPRVNEGSLLFL